MNLILRKHCRSNLICMVRNSSIVLLFTFSLFIMAGCEHNPEDVPEHEQRVITVNFTTKSLSGSLLKAATPEEITISKIILFGVDDQGVVVQTFPKFVNPTSSIQFTMFGDVKLLYAIANPTVSVEWATPLTVSDLMSMTVDFADAPQAPFLMSCIGEVNSTNSINLEFIRAVARIDITGTNGFQIESVTIMNTSAKGYVFDRAPLSIPTSEMVTYSNIESNSSIYLGESSMQNPVQFAVVGRYLNQPVSCTIVLTRNGQNIDVKRNTCYQVSIEVED